jgi:hypothetical protein
LNLYENRNRKIFETWKRERMQKRRRKKKGRAEAHGLEKPQVLRGLVDVKDGSVAVDLPNLGSQLVFILIELCFDCQGIFGLEIYCKNLIYVFTVKQFIIKLMNIHTTSHVHNLKFNSIDNS